jgi:putative flippase GtrA
MKAAALRFAEKHQVKIRFLVVGAWNTAFGYIVFVLLDLLFSHLFQKRYYAYMTAMVLAQIISVINAYIFHKFVTFKSTTKNTAMIVEFLRFSTTYIVTFCFNLIFLPILVELGHLTPSIAGAVLLLVTTGMSYLGHSRFSFKTKG